jgi:hypothetical protein
LAKYDGAWRLIQRLLADPPQYNFLGVKGGMELNYRNAHGEVHLDEDLYVAGFDSHEVLDDFLDLATIPEGVSAQEYVA